MLCTSVFMFFESVQANFLPGHFWSTGRRIHNSRSHVFYVFLCFLCIYVCLYEPGNTVGKLRLSAFQLRVVSHLFTGSLAGIGKLPALAGWYIRHGMYGIFLYCKIWRELHFVKFYGNSSQKRGLVHQKGGRSQGKRGSRQMYNTKGPYQVFFWYWLGKYQENTNRYHTKIPNRDSTLFSTV